MPTKRRVLETLNLKELQADWPNRPVGEVVEGIYDGPHATPPESNTGFGHFWLHQFISAPFQNFLVQHSMLGKTVNRIPLITFPRYPVLDPPDELKAEFESIAAPVWAKIHANQSESRTLAALRDTLLPKLLSGEIRV